MLKKDYTIFIDAFRPSMGNKLCSLTTSFVGLKIKEFYIGWKLEEEMDRYFDNISNSIKDLHYEFKYFEDEVV